MTKIDDINTNLKRIGDLIEKVIEQSNVEFEVPPPECPNCHQINPQVLFDEIQERGPFAEYLLSTSCMHCGKPFYGIPVMWLTVRGRDQAKRLMNEHLERMGLNVRNDG